jgi:hypothetical protein
MVAPLGDEQLRRDPFGGHGEGRHGFPRAPSPSRRIPGPGDLQADFSL